MTTGEFIQILQAERIKWDDAWRGIDLSGSPEISVQGKMNLRDILYHVAWYEREMVEVLRLRTLVGSPWWDLSLDDRNARILAEGQAISLFDAYQQEQLTFSQLQGLLSTLRDEELEQARYFKDMPPDWKPWEMIASNTYEHYPQHLQDIKG